MAARDYQCKQELFTAADVVPIIIQREVVAEHVGSHDIVQLGELDLSRALEELSVSLDQLHGLDVLSSSNVALINSLHLYIVVRTLSNQGNPTNRKRRFRFNLINHRPVKGKNTYDSKKKWN